jgi:type IV secretory pathway VirB2 component (pilin)
MQVSLVSASGIVAGSDGTPAMVAVVNWISALLFGAVGTSIAIIAIACLGFGLFTGRIPLRRASVILLGCFILFGARTIADGILRAGSGSDDVALQERQAAPKPDYPDVKPIAPATGANGYDPYAGAAINNK